MADEEKCAKLIRMGMSLGDLGGMVLVDEGYTDEEIRVADETVKLRKGEKFGVSRGRIVIHGQSGGFPFSNESSYSFVRGLQRG